ncbi:hypothetical protein TWF718_010138 [Orbilia javanica]|uniref:F-box domain-containing protein n=1 Tax=Orbilia javanica TaxID=47235 RepID=A0AAN8RDQ8_9PEZI
MSASTSTPTSMDETTIVVETGADNAATSTTSTSTPPVSTETISPPAPAPATSAASSEAIVAPSTPMDDNVVPSSPTAPVDGDGATLASDSTLESNVDGAVISGGSDDTATDGGNAAPSSSIARDGDPITPADPQNSDNGFPSSSSSSSSSNSSTGMDTPTSSEPSTPTISEITVLGVADTDGIAGVDVSVRDVVVEREDVVEGNTAVVVEGVREDVATVQGVDEGAAVVAEVNEAVPAAQGEAVVPVAAEVAEAAPAENNTATAPVENDPPVQVAQVENDPPQQAAQVANDPPLQAEQVENDPPAPAAPAGENDPAAPVENEAPPAEAAAAGDGTVQPPAETNDTTPTEETPAVPEPEPEPPWVYDPTKPTTILAIPPEIVLHTLNFLPLYNMKEFSLCSKRCRSLAVRRIFKHVNISSTALKAFQKDGTLHHVADAVFGIVIRTRYISTAKDLCDFMRECMYAPSDEEGGDQGLGVFKAVRRVKVSYGQIRYDRMSAIVNTGPLDSLSALDTRFIRAMLLSLRKVEFWKRVRWLDFVVKLWEDRHGVFDEAVEEGNEVKPEDKVGYLSEENEKFLEDALDSGVDDHDGVKDMMAIAPGLRDVRLINFKPRRRVAYRRKVDIFEILACMGGKPDKVVLEYITAGESIDLVPSSRIDEVRVQRGVEEIWVNMASFDVPGFMEEIGRRFVDLKSLLLVVTTAGGEGYPVPAKGVAAGWRRGVLQNMEKIRGLKTFLVPVRMGQEGENINHGRRKELGEVPKDIIERLAELVIYWIENGADGLEKVVFERKELEDEVDSAVGPGWVCKIRWENKRPKLEWTVENTSVGTST